MKQYNPKTHRLYRKTFLTHTVQMKPLKVLKVVKKFKVLLNPHGSDETDNINSLDDKYTIAS